MFTLFLILALDLFARLLCNTSIHADMRMVPQTVTRADLT